MKRSNRFPKRFLTKEDVGDGLTACIVGVEEQEIQSGNGSTEAKAVCLLQAEKPFIVNQENWDRIADLYGDDDDDWAGHWITLHHDSTVKFGNKRVGGIRVKPEKPAPERAGSGANGDSGATVAEPLSV